MFIEIKDLETQPIDFREEFSPGAIDLGPDLQQRSPLHAEGHADLVEEHHGKHKVVQDIRLKGKLDTILEAPCARCIEPVEYKVTRDFDLLYRPLGTDAGRDELSVTVGDGRDDATGVVHGIPVGERTVTHEQRPLSPAGSSSARPAD